VHDRRILYVQYTNPAAYPPLEHSSTMLADAGWDVTFIGTGAFGAAALTFAPRPNVHVLTHLFVSPGWRQKLGYLRFALHVAWHAATRRPRWVYASDPLAAPIALLLKLWPGVKLVYHEHDAPSVAGRDWVSAFTRWARRRLARRADSCVVPNQARADEFKKQTGAPMVHCVWNCPSAHEVSAPREPVAAGDDVWLFYHGSIVPSRLPEAVVRALALLPERVKLRIAGYETVGHLGYLDRLVTLARRLNVDGRIHAVGAVPTRRELLQWCGRSDIGVAFMPRDAVDFNERHMLGASNKPFDYLSQGLALLVSTRPDWVHTFVEAGLGLACDPMDAGSVAAAIERYLGDPATMRAMGERGRRRILEDWNYESQFGEMTRLLDGEASAPAGSVRVGVDTLGASCSR
jgi:glycosyltransferase involved in cell wall biosynthesis